MTQPTAERARRDRLRADLEGIEGVRRAVIDGSRPTVYVFCQGGTPGALELAVRARIAQNGFRADQADVQIGYLGESQPRRRVRLVRVSMEYPRTGRALATAILEWGNEEYTGQTEGESGSTVELRLAALATLRALSAVLAEQLTFALLGIRALRAFDRDFVAVLIRTEQLAADDALVGTSLVLEDLWQGAALAVLNATNRLLGNYLEIED